MSLHSRKIDALGARLHEVTARIDRTAAARDAQERQTSRGQTATMRKLVTIGIVVGLILAGTTIAGLMLNGIGLFGFIGMIVVALVAIAFLAFQPADKPPADYREDMPNRAVVQRLDALLAQKRGALPARAAARIDEISRQLPMLESRLGETEMLDPLAQDARRLMGRHLPDLIERYERVPAAYRGERDGEGLTVDERLVAGLDAAKTALDDLGRKLAHEDLSAFETQGRFIESRYKEDEELKGE